MLSLMIRHIHMGCERSEIAEKLTKHDVFGFFSPAMSATIISVWTPKKASLYCLNHLNFYPLQLHELSFSQHISGWKQIVLQLLQHMSWLFVHKIEGNFLEILSPRFVEVLCNSFIIDISFRKQSKIALLNVCP